MAVVAGVPIPIAIMVGYCTLVGAVYLAMAPLAYRALAASPSNATQPVLKNPPDYKTWSHIQMLSVRQAAHLWSEQDPNVLSDAPEVDMWANVLTDAIRRRELPVTLGEWAEAHDRKWAILTPNLDTTMLRRDLIAFAKSKGFDPRFLRDT